MFAIIGEDRSDVEALDVLLKRIIGVNNISVKTKGYSGCAEMLTKGSKQLKAYSKLGVKRFIVCYDSDRECPNIRRDRVLEKIVNPALNNGVNGVFCVLVPVQELEAWVLADVNAVGKVISTWNIQKEIHHPESIADPKEHLESLSKNSKKRPLYTHAMHNPIVAKHLSIEILLKKCPSFKPLYDFATAASKEERNGYCYQAM